MVVNSNCAKMTDQSLESQRFKDYSTGNKGGQSGFGMAVTGGVPAPFSQQASSFLPATTGFQIGQQQTNPSPFGQQQAQAQPAFGSPFGDATNQSFEQLAANAKLAQSVAAAAASPHSPNLDCSNLLKPECVIVLLTAVISSGLHIL